MIVNVYSFKCKDGVILNEKMLINTFEAGFLKVKDNTFLFYDSENDKTPKKCLSSLSVLLEVL